MRTKSIFYDRLSFCKKVVVIFLKERVVIVGGGVAAVTAAKTIRELDKDKEITIYSEEKFYPYNRMRISKEMLSGLDEEKILLEKKSWYNENNIQLNLNVKVTKIDTEGKFINLSNGEKVSYSKLLLANGAKNFQVPIKGINKKGVFSLRTLKDAKAIRDNLDKVENILHIGGGVQGLELVSVLTKAGKKVSIMELAPRLMTRQLDEKASYMLKEAAEKAGVKVLLSAKAEEVLGEEYLTGVLTGDNTVEECDMLIYAAGISPNSQVVEETNIKVNRGIVVNNRMETNIKDVYAAGDISELNGTVFGLWNVATIQGKVAGKNIAGEEAYFEGVIPTTIVETFGISLFSMGIIDEKQAEHTIKEEESKKNIYKKILIKEDRIIGALFLGDNRSVVSLKNAIANKLDISSIDYKNCSINDLIMKLKEVNTK